MTRLKRKKQPVQPLRVDLHKYQFVKFRKTGGFYSSFGKQTIIILLLHWCLAICRWLEDEWKNLLEHVSITILHFSRIAFVGLLRNVNNTERPQIILVMQPFSLYWLDQSAKAFLNEIRPFKGSSSCTGGRAVSSDAKDRRVESQHRRVQFIYWKYRQGESQGKTGRNWQIFWNKSTQTNYSFQKPEMISSQQLP